jgi:2-dehydro-3-deoxygluconokinase
MPLQPAVPEIVTFGEALVLMMADRPGPLEQAAIFHKRTAGAETNVAIGLARLGFQVAWASRLGADASGRYLLAAMQAEGIDCSRVAVDPAHATGLMFKAKSADGSDPAIEYHRRGSAASHMGAGDLDKAWLTSARHLHATGVFAGVSGSTLALMKNAMDAMRAAGKTVSFDPNLRPALWSSESAMRDAINDLAARADWVLPGIEEGRLLTGEATPEAIARFYRQRGAKLAVVKLGKDGAYFEGVAGCGFVAGFSVDQVVDTVGAGDGFAVGVISGLLDGLLLPDAVRRGAWIGAEAVQVPGDSEGLPTRSALEKAGF